jgi:SNF2 family DNA or RNA helicase
MNYFILIVCKIMAQLNQSDRPPCGTRKSKLNPTGWTKDELVDAAVSSGLLSKSKATKASMSALCFLLGLSGAQVVSSTKECGPRKSKAHPSVYTTDELRKLAISRADELGLSKSEIRTLSKDELCNILFSSNIKVSSEQKVPLSAAVAQLPTSESCLVPYNKDIKLKEHQIRIVKHLLKHRGIIAIFPTGSGKSLAAVTSLNCILSNYPTVKAIFVAPLSLVENFQKELVKFGLGPDTEAAKRLNLKDRLKLYSKESFFSEIQKAKNANSCKDVFLIIDEAHNYRNAIDMTAAKPKGKISASMINCASQAFKVLLLTATPMKNRESDIINLISMVDGTPLKNAPSVKYFNKVIMNDDNEFARYFKCKFSMLNRVADDPNYPERIDEPQVRLLMTPEFYKKYYAVQEAQSKKYLIDLYGDPKHFKMFYSALRRASLSLDDEKSPKVRWTFEKIVSEAAAGRKSIVYSAWKDSGLFKVRKLLDEAKIPYGMIIGDLSSAQRTFYKNEYNNGKIKILLLSRAGGEGLDLTETRNVILMEPNWNAGDDEQIIGRADRFGSHSKLSPSERNVHVWRLFMIKPLRLRTNPETGKLDSPKSVDQILYDMSYVDKEPKIETMLERLQPLSIENIDCDCYLSTNGNCKLSVPYSSEVKAEAPLIEEVNIDYDMDSKGYEERAKKFKRLKIGGYNPPRVGTSLLAPVRRSGLRPRSVKPRAPLKLRRSKSARG